MGLLDSINNTFRPVQIHGQPGPGDTTAAPVTPSNEKETFQPQRADGGNDGIETAPDVEDDDVLEKPVSRDLEAGVAAVEALQVVWGKYGLWIVAAGWVTSIRILCDKS